MSELRNEVLQAEEAIRQLAGELARAKGIADRVAIVEKRLSDAASLLDQSRRTLEGIQVSIQDALAQAKDSLISATAAMQQASNQLSQSSRAVASETREVMTEFGEKVQITLNAAVESLRQASDQLSQSSQAISSNLTQAIKDFGERVRQTLQQAYQNSQEQLIASIGEAQKTLISAANSLMEFRTGFEKHVNTLVQQNEQTLQRIIQQDAEIKKLSSWLKFCLILSCFTTLGTIAVILLLLLR